MDLKNSRLLFVDFESLFTWDLLAHVNLASVCVVADFFLLGASFSASFFMALAGDSIPLDQAIKIKPKTQKIF